MLVTAFTDVHFESTSGEGANIKYLHIFVLVAILILLLAVVNYMSLSTARATLRAKEVGVRKVSGASRANMAMQFYIESAVYISIAFLLGYLLSATYKTWFFNKLQLTINNAFFYSPTVLTLLASLFIVTVFMAGSYPAIILSAFKPITTLKGKFSKQPGGTAIRKTFTVLQFAISTGLIICALIINNQLYYIRHTDTGMKRENVVMLPVTVNIGDHYQSYRKEILSFSAVSEVATSHYAMYKGYDIYSADGPTPGDKVSLPVLAVDEHFFSTLGIQWKERPSTLDAFFKPGSMVINEALAERLELPASAIGSYYQNTR